MRQIQRVASVSVGNPYDWPVTMLDAQGIAALDPRIRFGSILLLFIAGVAVSVLAVILCGAYDAPKVARSLVAGAVADLCWIGGYQLLSEDRGWVSLRGRFSKVRSGVLWACVAGAIAPILLFLGVIKILMWSGIDLPPLPASDFLTGGLHWLPVVFLVIVVIAPAAEELMVRGLLLDWLRQKMPVWPAILTSALVFGLLHGIALHSGASGWLQLGYRIGLGILGAYLAVRYRSLLPSFVLHATNNSVAVIASGFLS
jgi:membrane protease YdiL (CAAX protease family)